jgi:hypothetical protein
MVLGLSKLPNTKLISSKNFQIINKMSKEAEKPALNKGDVIRSKFVFVRYRNWSGQEKTQAIAAENEDVAKQWLKDSGFEAIEVKQIYFL